MENIRYNPNRFTKKEEMNDVTVIKKNGTKVPFDGKKIEAAMTKSANRACCVLTKEDIDNVCQRVINSIGSEIKNITVANLHNLVERSLTDLDAPVAEAYKNYRNYKNDFVAMLDEVYKKAQTIMYIGDKENSNTDSSLVATKRSLIYNELNKELYKKFFLNLEELQAIQDGYIYIHDMSSRRDTINCCLFDLGNVLNGGFEMGNLWYNEPKTLATAFSVVSDLILAVASQQYGGFTIPEIDAVLAKYASKSYDRYVEKYTKLGVEEIKSKDQATRDVLRDIRQGYQGLEYKLNSVGSSRGDYPFVTFTFGRDTNDWSKHISSIFLEVHGNGQGKKGFKKPVLFPKLVFLYDEKLHGPGGTMESVFLDAIDCSSKSMYPDYLSLTGDSYVAEAYKKYNVVVSPMGCRAFLSLYWERGGVEPADENDKPITVGRFNLGAISLNLPMILQKSKLECKDFHDALDHYMEMIRRLHLKTIQYLGNMKAGTNPVVYCEGGFYGGNLKPEDDIAPILKSATVSFGVTALNETQMLYNGKSLVEDAEFALETMKYINDKVAEFKKEDNVLYAVYGTPAESLCGLQVEQFRKKYGIIEGVSSKNYNSNSFHCHVSEDISGIEKQDYEKRFWDLFNGGKIQYVKYPIDYNKEAMVNTVRRGMELGLYEGVNLSLSYCNSCSHQELNMEICSKCGSEDLTKIERMNGYLSHSRVKGSSRLNDAKMEEIKDRRSM